MLRGTFSQRETKSTQVFIAWPSIAPPASSGFPVSLFNGPVGKDGSFSIVALPPEAELLLLFLPGSHYRVTTGAAGSTTTVQLPPKE